MTKLSATPTTLATVLRSARGGETIALAPGVYGDVAIRKRAFAEPIRLVPSNPKIPAVFRSLTLQGVEGLETEGLAFRFTPDQATKEFSTVVMIDACKRVSIRGGEIASGPAVNGIAPEATAKDRLTGNVLGLPTARGLTIQNSEDVLVESAEIHHCDSGAVIGGGQRVTLRGNLIHHLRKTGIKGGCSDLTIEGNSFHTSTPWRYGETQFQGDHGDWIAVWNGGTTLVEGVIIRNNRMRTGDGAPMMGGWIQGQKGKIRGFEYTGNLIVGGDHQGFVTSDAEDGLIARNVFMQDRAGGKHIGIIVGDRSARVTVRDNLVGSVSDKAKGAAGSVLEDNRILQHTAKGRAGYTSPEFIAEILATRGEVYPVVLKALFPKAARDPKYPSRRSAFEAWDLKLAEMGEIVDFLRSGEA